MHAQEPRAPWLGAVIAGALAAPFAHAQSCRAESGALVPVVVELYTSEGCNSCPPADRWLSTLKDKPGVLAASRGEGGRATRVLAVVTDAASGAIVQALQLRCSG